MFKTVKNRVWAFDAEWIPDPVAGKLLYNLPDDMPDLDVLKHMWKEGGASEEDPTPYLKTVVCRIVSVAAIDRLVSEGNTKLHLLSLPRELNDPEQISEKSVVSTFLDKVGQYNRNAKTYGYFALNFGNAKGLEFDRVLIIPHGPIKKYLKSGDVNDVKGSLSKFYVAVTRAKHSVAFLYDGECSVSCTKWQPTAAG